MDIETAHVDETLATTRAVRRRLDLDRPVDNQILLDCIDLAEQAPTGGNLGSRRWIILRDQAQTSADREPPDRGDDDQHAPHTRRHQGTRRSTWNRPGDDDPMTISIELPPRRCSRSSTAKTTFAAIGFDADTGPTFRYVKHVVSGDTAVMEFETEMGGKYVNGVDIITVDGDGKIVEFRVMVRPLQALNAVHELMGAELAALEARQESAS